MSTDAHTESPTTDAATIDDDVIEKAARTEAAREQRLRVRDLILAIGTPVLLLALWEWGSRAGWIDARLFSQPTEIAARTWEMLRSGELGEHISITIYRFGTGYLIGGLLGVVVGMILGISRATNAAFGPLFSALYALPKIAILPLLFLIFGLNDTSRIIAVAITVFFVLQINTQGGIRQLDARLQEAATAYGAVGIKRLVHVVLPGVLPAVFTGFRVAAGLAVVVVTAVEFVASESGLGFLIWNSWTLFQPEKMYVGLVTVAIIGALVTLVVNVVEYFALPWRRRGGRRRGRRRAGPQR
ncbi:Alkanesulfonates transport system permease protein [Actinomycetales bacterium JB111]|nr:Alkanesulfonates transport system permease protein [Actinomycetales bacterium JB111]